MTDDDGKPPAEPPPPEPMPPTVQTELPTESAPMPPPVEMMPPPLPFDAMPLPPPPFEPQAAYVELPLVPHDASLSAAVGAPSPAARARKSDDAHARYDGADLRSPRSRRTMTIIAGAGIVGLAIIALAFLGHANAQRYLITCTAARVTAEQGRAFPPWGSRAMSGPEWKPIALPSDAECTARETDDEDELGRWYSELLVERASATLSVKNPLELAAAGLGAGGGSASPIDAAADQLQQALLLARSADRRDQRKDIERLQGDVDYWRASARLRDASTVLLDAAKQFDAAAAQRPRHVTDAAAWSGFLHHLADELHGGPNGQPAPVAVPGTNASTSEPRVTAPPGVALPVEAEPPPPEATPPDAGVVAGGVLL